MGGLVVTSIVVAPLCTRARRAGQLVVPRLHPQVQRPARGQLPERARHRVWRGRVPQLQPGRPARPGVQAARRPVRRLGVRNCRRRRRYCGVSCGSGSGGGGGGGGGLRLLELLRSQPRHWTGEWWISCGRWMNGGDE